VLEASRVEEEVIEAQINALQEASKIIRKTRSVITAFNTNIDALHFLKSVELEEIISRFDGETLRKSMINPPNKIVKEEDFLAGLLLSMETGRGMEWIIESEDTFEWIEENFPTDEYRMGGLAGILANVLARLNVGKIYPHVASLPELQAKLFFKGESIKIPVTKGEFLSFESPSRAVRQDDEPLIHHIFEYPAGLRVKLNGELITPSSNRFIATWDEKNTRLHIDESFLEGTKEIIRDVDLAVISGYHMMRESRHFTRKDCFKKIEFTKNLFEEWKKHSDIKIHLELAYFTDLEILSYVLKLLNRTIDGLGLNEDELIQCINSLGNRELYARINENPNPKNLLDGMLYLATTLDLKNIVVHTRELCIAVSKKPAQKNLLNALALGNSIAAARAVTGKYCNLSEILNVLKEGRLHISEEGLKGFNAITRKLRNKGYRLGGKFSAENANCKLWFMPTATYKKPLSTVGLGDCFTAGYGLLAY